MSKKKKGGDVAQWHSNLPSICKALGSILGVAKERDVEEGGVEIERRIEKEMNKRRE